ncbi:hypothetical protein F5Y11DRAFT_41883 [Daldinia sp. FL1419]|nr:hypothetical protein F5Y11DRAFT_41883 [Daldinia sp. FL1419]
MEENSDGDSGTTFCQKEHGQHGQHGQTYRLIRDDRLRECIPHVLRWSCLVSRRFINWQRHAPAQQDGVTLFKSRIFTCVYRPGSLPSPLSLSGASGPLCVPLGPSLSPFFPPIAPFNPFGLALFNCVFTDPCPALTKSNSAIKHTCLAVDGSSLCTAAPEYVA